jgi:hypothetical protein
MIPTSPRPRSSLQNSSRFTFLEDIPVLVDATFTAGGDSDFGSQIFGIHKSLQDLRKWWRARTSKNSMDYRGHLEQVRRNRESLMQSELLNASLEQDEPTPKSEKRPQTFVGNFPTKNQEDETHSYSADPESVIKLPSIKLSPKKLSETPNLVKKLFLDQEKMFSSDIDEMERSLQQLIDASVHNMTWATKTLFKYRSIQRNKRQLKQLGTSEENLIGLRACEFRSQPVLPISGNREEKNNRSNYSLTSFPVLTPVQALLNNRSSTSPIIPIKDVQSLDPRSSSTDRGSVTPGSGDVTQGNGLPIKTNESFVDFNVHEQLKEGTLERCGHEVRSHTELDSKLLLNQTNGTLMLSIATAQQLLQKADSVIEVPKEKTVSVSRNFQTDVERCCRDSSLVSV